MTIANDNAPLSDCHGVVPQGVAITIRRPASRFGKCMAEYVRESGDGKHVVVRKLISSMWHARWTKPMKIDRTDILEVHGFLAEPCFRRISQ